MSTLATPNTTVKPSHINTNRHFFDAFSNRETEISANWIVRFCRQRNGDSWAPFKLADLQKFYEAGRNRAEAFHFNRLTQGWVIVRDGMVAVSADFVAKCYAASPVS